MARYLVFDNGNRVHDGSCTGVCAVHCAAEYGAYSDLLRTYERVKCLVLLMV